MLIAVAHAPTGAWPRAAGAVWSARRWGRRAAVAGRAPAGTSARAVHLRRRGPASADLRGSSGGRLPRRGLGQGSDIHRSGEKYTPGIRVFIVVAV